MEGIIAMLKLKNNKIEKSEHYLRAQLAQKIICGVDCWIMSSEEYVKAALAIVERLLQLQSFT